MFCERATAESRSLSLAAGSSTQQGQRQLLVYAGALSQGSYKRSTYFPQERYEHWHPACCLQQLLPPLLYDYSFPVITTNVTPPIPGVKADEWCRASMQVYPRRRGTEPNPFQRTPERGCSSTYQPSAVLARAEHELSWERTRARTGHCTPEGGGRWKRWAFSPGPLSTCDWCAPCYWYSQLWPMGKSCAKEQ